MNRDIARRRLVLFEITRAWMTTVSFAHLFEFEVMDFDLEAAACA